MFIAYSPQNLVWWSSSILHTYGTKYLRMDQVKTVEHSLWKVRVDMVCSSRPYHLKFFKGCAWSILGYFNSYIPKFCTTSSSSLWYPFQFYLSVLRKLMWFLSLPFCSWQSHLDFQYLQGQYHTTIFFSQSDFFGH